MVRSPVEITGKKIREIIIHYNFALNPLISRNFCKKKNGESKFLQFPHCDLPIVSTSVKSYLVLIKLAVLVSRLSLLLEGDNDKTNEDIDHKKGNDNDVDEIKHGHDRSIIVNRANVLGIGVDGHVQDSRPAFKGRNDE